MSLLNLRVPICTSSIGVIREHIPSVTVVMFAATYVSDSSGELFRSSSNGYFSILFALGSQDSCNSPATYSLISHLLFSCARTDGYTNQDVVATSSGFAHLVDMR